MRTRRRTMPDDRAGSGIPKPRLRTVFAALALFAAPAQALPPEDVTADSETPNDPYVYPSAPGVSEPVPSGWLRGPAAVVDVLVVRPMMTAGLVAGAGLSLVVLPFQAPTAVTDETVETLADQAMSTFTRPAGEF